MLKAFIRDLQIFERIQLVLFLMVFFSLGYLVVNPQLTLGYIPIEDQTKELKTIAATIHAKGDVRRKLINDLLWLPVHDKMQLYLGDSIYTSGDSTVEIVFGPDSSIVLKENCLVKIGLYANKPLIELMTGEFSVKVKEPNVVYVRQAKGVQEKKANAKQDEQSVSSRKTEDQELSEPNNAPAEAAIEPEPAAEPEPAQPDKQAVEIPDNLKPFPGPNSVFLHFGNGKIRMTSGRVCQGPCTIEAEAGKQKLKKEFANGEMPQLTLQVQGKMNTTVQWFFEEKGTRQKFEFEIRPYDTENFNKAIAEKKAIEVISE